MTTRVFLGGVLAAVVMFVWSFISHDILGLGEAGFSEIPNEGPVLAAMKSSIGDKTGLYIFPGLGLPPNASRQDRETAMKQADEKMKTNPSGLLMYHATRTIGFSKLLITEFVTELIEALIAVWLLSRTRIESFGGRVGFVFVLGVLAAITTDVPYWNWYGFPTAYTQAQLLIHLVQFLIVGIVAALVMGKSRGVAA